MAEGDHTAPEPRIATAPTESSPCDILDSAVNRLAQMEKGIALAQQILGDLDGNDDLDKAQQEQVADLRFVLDGMKYFMQDAQNEMAVPVRPQGIRCDSEEIASADAVPQVTSTNDQHHSFVAVASQPRRSERPPTPDAPREGEV